MSKSNYAMYKGARVRLLSEPDKSGRVQVRVTSNRHPELRHGQHLKVSQRGLSEGYVR